MYLNRSFVGSQAGTSRREIIQAECVGCVGAAQMDHGISTDVCTQVKGVHAHPKDFIGGGMKALFVRDRNVDVLMTSLGVKRLGL
jgi:hypothetical protein